MAALRHHPQHLDLLILTQTDRTRRVIAGSATTHRILAELKFRVGVDDFLIKPHDYVFIMPVSIVLSDEDYAGKNDAIRVRVRVMGPRAGTRGAAAEVGGEDEGGEKYKEAKGDSDGVAEADVVDIGGSGGDGGGGRGHG
ncbi:hypothetical protein L6164_021170 [Bauhinia variegata]|uniref:Uncharacterized protein n=1 Tax=Bauhinia variegata TaxID=167791 RepID=A0ACB9MYZ0_BAUVA|nr:hypothetical protein L6164_021170 [Bauhinia variegata]